MSDSDDVYLIWSNEHGAWWGPGRVGYVARVAQAGRYRHEEAVEICTNAMLGRCGRAPLPELAVRLADVEFMLRRYAERYPGHDPEPEGNDGT